MLRVLVFITRMRIFEAPESLGVEEGKSESMGMRWIRAEWDVGSWRVDVSSMDERGQG
jgi:hypothetical protein